jgi:hypothetical protein
LRKNSKIGGWGFEGAWLQPRLTVLFKDLRHGWEAVPLQNSQRQEFFRELFSHATNHQIRFKAPQGINALTLTLRSASSFDHGTKCWLL